MNHRFQYREHRWSRTILAGVVVLTCLKVWVGPAQILPVAQAQIPDSAGQRLVLIEEARKTNQLLREIKRTLETKTLHVQVQGADNIATAPVAGRKSKP